MIPRSLNISGQAWKIVLDRTLLDTKGRHGETNAITRTITICSAQAMELQKATLLHEVMHAILATSRLHGLSDTEEESVVETLEAPLLQVLRDNPTWWRK